ncbi:hypothetical protein E2C01_015465 [Portunus trituberculatus]|uniref:Uncharacterized protein n=1 Tax=Portunus trituberculatus TaxID=210409 RepID=A0A5B7DLQ8_PORTR|nr:hypothetical protein [Portunus trituberculatus]
MKPSGLWFLSGLDAEPDRLIFGPERRTPALVKLTGANLTLVSTRTSPLCTAFIIQGFSSKGINASSKSPRLTPLHALCLTPRHSTPSLLFPDPDTLSVTASALSHPTLPFSALPMLGLGQSERSGSKEQVIRSDSQSLHVWGKTDGKLCKNR